MHSEFPEICHLLVQHKHTLSLSFFPCNCNFAIFRFHDEGLGRDFSLLSTDLNLSLNM